MSDARLEFVANVWTGKGTPRRMSVVCEGGRIASVREVAAGFTSPGAISLPAGALIVPGLHDAHLHLLEGGLRLDQLDLFSVRSAGEFQERLRAFVSSREWDKGDWVEAHRLNEAFVQVTRKEIDKVCPDYPVFIWSHDWHSAFVNSKALVVAHVDSRMKNPDGGEFVKDETGVLNGVLRETAAYHVRKFIPDPTPEREHDALLKAQALAFSHGFTAVSCSVRADYLRGYLNFADSGAQKIRLNIWPVTADFDFESSKFERRDETHFRMACFKGFADGALGSKTAAMWQPYENDGKNAGLSLIREGPLARFIRTAHKAGYQVAVHAIGDRANSICLDAFEMASASGVGPELRPRIEHCQILRERDIKRFAELGVIASMQPIHCSADMHMVEPRIGAERAKFAYAWRSLLDAGAVLAFGSDWPVEELSAMAGIHAAVTRESNAGLPTGGWQPQERISVEQALRAYTMGSAYAANWEGDLGEITVGRLADLTILDRNLFSIEPREILQTTVLMTVVGGEIVYRAA